MNKLLICIILYSLCISAKPNQDVLFKITIKNNVKQYMMRASTHYFETGRFADGERINNVAPDSKLLLKVQGDRGVEGWMKWDIIHTGIIFIVLINFYNY